MCVLCYSTHSEDQMSSQAKKDEKNTPKSEHFDFPHNRNDSVREGVGTSVFLFTVTSCSLKLCPQAVNFWQVLVMNDEHTERRYLLYFLLGWGLPALVIVVLVVVLLGGFGWTIHSVYGLVQGDV